MPNEITSIVQNHVIGSIHGTPLSIPSFVLISFWQLSPLLNPYPPLYLNHRPLLSKDGNLPEKRDSQ